MMQFPVLGGAVGRALRGECSGLKEKLSGRLTRMVGLLGVAAVLGIFPTWIHAVDLQCVLERSSDVLASPEKHLIKTLRPDAGMSFSLGESADRIRGRLKVENVDAECQTVTDAASGVTFLRRARHVPKLGSVLIQTEVVNRGEKVVEIRDVAPVDWIFDAECDQDSMRYEALTYRQDQWYGSTYWTGPDWTRVGKDWHHSGINTPSVRRFVIPRDGHVVISGRVHKADTNNGGGDGVRLMIRHGDRDVWQQEIAGDDDRGVTPKVELDVKKGDAVRFVVHRRGEIAFDTTHWDPVITYSDGESFQASDAFAEHKQGYGGWFFEMDVSEQSQRSLTGPRVRWFGRRFVSRNIGLSAEKGFDTEASDSLPAWVIADRYDAGGIVVASPTGAPCRLSCDLTDSGQIQLQIRFGDSESGAIRLAPNESMKLRPVLLGSYTGSSMAGVTKLNQMLNSAVVAVDIVPLQNEFRQAAVEASVPGRPNGIPELDYCAMIQEDWNQQDKIDGSAESYANACARHLVQVEKLWIELQDAIEESGQSKGDVLECELREHADLSDRCLQSDLSLADHQDLYYRVRWLKRRVLLANPLLDFGEMLFCKRVPTSYSHLVMQYYGWRARPGGGLFVLERPGYSLRCRDILNGKLANGNVLEPRLSYDGQEIVFSYVKCRKGGYEYGSLDNTVDDGFYHVWSVNVDGSDLRQISKGPYDDLMPTWLPDGGIVFSSTRRRGYARCFGAQFSRRWHVYTLHRMNRDGTGIQCLSVHDTNEWFPVISDSGHILYSRWDYIDRDAVTHQNLWAMRPDGSNTIAVWGNATSSPHCTFQPKPIPGTGKFVFTASAHHSITGGSLAIVDPAIGDNGQEAITRITPEIAFPEAESRDIKEYYASPWPLSEKHFLVAYSPSPLVWEPGANAANALGIYLLDVFGNRELIYRDPEIGSTNPTPMVRRPRPPVVPNSLAGEDEPCGELTLVNVYEGLGDIPRGAIKKLRVVQIFPKTTPIADFPRIGLAREENARAILGTVPVEPDGSAKFQVPAGKPVLFQALDENGFAYQTMRTIIYVQPGERTACIGCHESRSKAPGNLVPTAAARPASKIDPGTLGGRPFSFVEIVQPVLDRYCVECHGAEEPAGKLSLVGTPHDGFTQSYWSLCGDQDFWGPGTNLDTAKKALVPRFGGRNQVQVTPPGGMYGARGSRLVQLIRSGHEGVEMDLDSLQRLAAWIDCNAVFFGVYGPDEQRQQLTGRPSSMPDIQ